MTLDMGTHCITYSAFTLRKNTANASSKSHRVEWAKGDWGKPYSKGITPLSTSAPVGRSTSSSKSLETHHTTMHNDDVPPDRRPVMILVWALTVPINGTWGMTVCMPEKLLGKGEAVGQPLEAVPPASGGLVTTRRGVPLLQRSPCVRSTTASGRRLPRSWRRRGVRACRRNASGEAPMSAVTECTCSTRMVSGEVLEVIRVPLQLHLHALRHGTVPYQDGR